MIFMEKGTEMDETMTTSRRGMLGLAPLAVAGVATMTVLPREASATPRPAAPRPTQAELDRVARLYGGELGGGRGAR